MQKKNALKSELTTVLVRGLVLTEFAFFDCQQMYLTEMFTDKASVIAQILFPLSSVSIYFN